MALFLYFVAYVILVAAATPQLSLNVDQVHGNYTVSVDGQYWLASDAYSFCYKNNRYSTADNTLNMISHQVTKDDETKLTFVPVGLTKPRFVTSFRAKDNQIIFEQSFPDGVEGH